MSDENSFEATPSEEIPPIPQMSEPAVEVSLPEIPEETPVAETPVKAAPRSRPRWIAPAWFFFGVIIGIAAFAAYSTLTVKPAAPSQTESLDPGALRAAAREGFIEAIATLQAGGGQQQPAAQAPQGPQGKVNIVYKHSAFLGQESVWAAQAAECAADQGKFWEYHDLLFDKQTGENVGTFTKENLMTYAKELGLDSAKFDPCLKNDETLPRVAADTQEGRSAGVSGTPTFFINGKPLVGAQPVEVFQSTINTALGQ